MGQSNTTYSTTFGQRVGSWVKAQSNRTIHCRECDASVSITEKICAHCGASDPARVPWSAVTAMCALAAAAIVAIHVLL
jgi:ribosomal protein L37E